MNNHEMDQLRAMRTFARVVDEGSFAAAARAQDEAPAVVTRLVAELEAHLGARLLHRSTRRMALTEVGERYLERVRQVLADVDEAQAQVQAATSEPSGLVRLRLPPAFAVHQLARHLPAFHARHPKVSLELSADLPVETVDDTHDLTLMVLSQPLQGDFVARRLARSEIVMCASPAYLRQRGCPRVPQDLARHELLLPMRSDVQRGVRFERAAGARSPAQTVEMLPPHPLLRTASADTLLAAALAGLGVVGMASMVIDEALREGRLERVLPRWRLFSLTLWVGMPTRKHLPARTRALLDFLVETFGARPDRDPWLEGVRLPV
jgi:DNA-binding transcriptional LysR family regulator